MMHKSDIFLLSTYDHKLYIYIGHYKYIGETRYMVQFLESQITSWTAEVASKKQPKIVKAIEMATWSQKLCKGLQKFGSDVCLIPVRFRLLTPEAADPALIIAYANSCNLDNS